MLQPMQQPASSQPPSSPSSFAGLLATLASPPPTPQSDVAADAPLWNSNDLAEDVATLSYERALRAHARYRPDNRDLACNSDRPETQIDFDTARAAVAAPDRDLRSASVTIRLSRAECARLHQRATEAGLTVSAYLRSCALEAETLRAQVKQALAELKAGNEGTRGQGNKQTDLHGREGVRLTRVLVHIGKLWVGLASRPSA